MRAKRLKLWSSMIAMVSNPVIWLPIIVATIPTCIYAQTIIPASTDIVVEKPIFAGQTLKPDATIEIKISRALTPKDGRIAICIGPLDLSQQTEAIDELNWRVKLQTNLPTGAQEVVVHLIRGNEWLDLARFPVTIEGTSDISSGEAKGDTPSKKFDPKFTVTVKGQIYEQSNGTVKPTNRARFQDISIAGALSYEAKPAGFELKSAANLTGVSRRNDTVRFANDANAADKLDLNDYKFELARGAGQLSLGHVSFGNHPMLLSNRDSRGLTGSLAITPWLDVSAAAMRATSIVGINDFFGLASVDHRILAGAVGIEMFPTKKGLLRAEFMLMDANATPQANVNQGQIPDTEKNRGYGIRLSAVDPNSRWKIDGFWARSRYVNPTSPELAQGSTLVEVRPETRDAYRLESSYQILKDIPWLGEKLPINLRTFAGYDYAEPLFKSLGAEFIADQQIAKYGMEWRVGEISLNVLGSRKNDNVSTIPTILKTGTYESGAQLTVPIGGLMAIVNKAEKADAIWPQLQLETRRTRQYTLRIPDGTNAKSSFWPDQLNFTHKLQLGWTFEKFSTGYSFEIGDQDNRQPDRERSDFLIHTHTINFDWKVTDRLAVLSSINRSRNFSYEKSQATYNNGGSLGVDWRFHDAWSLKTDYSKTIAYDSLNQQYSNNLTAAMQLTYKFSTDQLGRSVTGQAFMRAAYINNRALDSALARVLSGKQMLVQTGLSLNF